MVTSARSVADDTSSARFAQILDRLQHIEELLMHIQRAVEHIAGEPAPGERGLGH